MRVIRLLLDGLQGLYVPLNKVGDALVDHVRSKHKDRRLRRDVGRLYGGLAADFLEINRVLSRALGVPGLAARRDHRDEEVRRLSGRALRVASGASRGALGRRVRKVGKAT